MKRKKVLITGITGGFGSLLKEKLSHDLNIKGTTTQKEKCTSDIFFLDHRDLSLDLASPIFTEKWDGVVINAGIAILGNVHEFTEEELERTFRVNVFGPLQMLKNLQPNDKKIVFISSKAPLLEREGLKVYGNSKDLMKNFLLEMEYKHLLIIYPHYLDFVEKMHDFLL